MQLSRNLPSIFYVVFWTTFIFGCTSDLPEEIALEYKSLPEKVDFNFHIRPILSDRCFSCHGPDEKARKADLRLDLEEPAFAALSSGNGYGFVPKSLHRSQVFQRMIQKDGELKMPPPSSNLSLSNREIALVAKWIKQGATWKPHWSFLPIQSPAIPDIPQEWNGINPVDQFVWAKLETEDLMPNEPASKEQLLRRVSLDLTGLPPTTGAIDSFLSDNSAGAYEKVVDRLLASTANAERLTMDWLDLARYADSHGMHADGARRVWPWRDWVISAFKKNMPYSDFVTWQLAGDLIPNATKEHILATAFNRNHPMTAEGGVIDEEFRLNYVFDRLETYGTAFLGMTFNCARCHDHKFDAISQADYYQMASFFNNVKEVGMIGDDGDYGPMLLLSNPEQDETLKSLNNRIANLEDSLSLTELQLAEKIEFIETLPDDFQPNGIIADLDFEQIIIGKNKENKTIYKVDGAANYTTSEALQLKEGKLGKAAFFTGEYDEVYIHDLPIFDAIDPFSVTVWVNTSKKEPGKTQLIIGNAGDKNNFWRGWDLFLDSLNRPTVRLIHALPHNYLMVQAIDSVKLNSWHHLAFSYDGSTQAEGVTIYLDGQPLRTKVGFDNLYKNIHPIGPGAQLRTKRPLRIAKSYRSFNGDNGIFKGLMDDLKIYNRALLPFEVAHISDVPLTLEKEAYYKLVANDLPLYKEKWKALYDLRKERLEFFEDIPEIMVMREMNQPRTMFVLNRGAYDAPLYSVEAKTPGVLSEFPENFPVNRLGLARWTFHPDNPLTARVTVNRYWQMLFGNGLVKTPEDFGVQGALPSHPALLDWLANYFIESNWDVKALLKTIVMSAVYRQSSIVDPEKRAKDPENRLLARGPSYRLPAEMIRDNALSASGLLVDVVGGESVRPYQPKGLWIEKGNFSYQLLNYKETLGDSLYRRSLYTFVKRTSPHPAMVAFDAPNRDICTIKRENTNTPIQSLVLLNDPQFVEAAKVLAERIQKEGGENIEDQIKYGFRLVTSRYPDELELSVLSKLFNKQLKYFETDLPKAKSLLAVGTYRVNKNLNVSKTAALAVVSNTILNHDEAYMKR